MRAGILLALLLLAVPFTAASAETVARPATPEVVAPQTDVEAPAMHLDLAEARQHAPAAPADAAAQAPRPWSFWWVVGALVVAGIILAVVT